MTSSFSNSPETPQEQFDIGPLSWVMGEVREAISNAGKLLLDATLQDAETQSTTLLHAKSYLHQAHGALQIVDIDGVSIVTETIEDLIDRLQSGQLEISRTHVDVISDAFHAILCYLEDLLTGCAHQPVRLFPYYRALLEIKGAERIHPADLFFPSLSVHEKIPELTLVHPNAPVNYSNLRQRFEKLLLTVLTVKENEQQLVAVRAMHDLIKEIEQAQSTSQAKAFWLVMRGFSESVAQGAIENKQYVKQIFGRINLQIRRLVDGVTTIPERLLRDALFFIAQVDQPSPFVAQILLAYGLNNQVPLDYEQKNYGQIPANVLTTAKEQLSLVKNLWGRIANGDVGLADKFSQKMKDLAESGASLNSPPLYKLLRELSGIARHAESSPDRSKMGLELATSLLFVENALEQITHLPGDFSERADEIAARLLSVVSGDEPPTQASWMGDLSREAQQKKTMSVLVSEMQVSLRQVEKTLDEYFRDAAHSEVLAPVDGILHQIGGALAILDQDDAMLAVEHVRIVVKRFADDQDALKVDTDSEAYRNVAQNIGALSFFIETLQNQPELAKKKFSFDSSVGVFRSNLLEKQAEKELLPSIQMEPATPLATMMTAEQELSNQQHESARLAVSLVDEPNNPELQAKLKDSLESERSVAILLDDTDASARARVAIDLLDKSNFSSSPEDLNNIVVATAQLTSAPEISSSVDLPVNDEAIDAELLEIFLEEAEEVLEFVRHTVPLSRLDPANQEHLISLRRSFHTLKGSGRMVGLMVFGEAAWSIEQVMNLWLSESRDGAEPLYALLDLTEPELSAWVADLKKTGQANRSGAAIIAAAERLKNGQDVVEIESQSSAVSSVEMPMLDGSDEKTLSATYLNEEPLDVQLKEHIESHIEVTPLAETQVDEPEVIAAAALEFDELEDLDFSPLESKSIPHADTALATFIEPGLTSAFTSEVEVSGNFDETAHPITDDFVLDEVLAHEETSIQLDVSHFEDLPAQIETAEIIDFSDLSRPLLTQDDNVKRIGDIEISLPLHTIYMAETDEIVRFLSQDFAEWRHESSRHVSRHAVHAAHSLAGSSATVGLIAAQELAHSLEMVLQRVERHPVSLEFSEFDVLDHAVECLKGMLKKFAVSEMAQHEPTEILQLEKLLQAVIIRSGVGDDEDEFITSTNERLDQSILVADETSEPDSVYEVNDTDESLVTQTDETSADVELLAPLQSFDEVAHDDLSVLEEPQFESANATVALVPDADELVLLSDSKVVAETALNIHDDEPQSDNTFASAVTSPDSYEVPPSSSEFDVKLKDDLDIDLLPVFIEEGNDLLPMVGQLLRSWQQQPDDASIPQAILRLMHTIKGSARMAGAMQLGQHTHDMETRIESLMHSGGAVRQPLLDDLLSRHDYSMQLFDRLQNPTAAVESIPYAELSPAQELEQFQASLEAGSLDTLTSGNDELPAFSPATPIKPLAASRSVIAPAVAANTPAGPVALVRVRADILDRLVNQAGEVSISRSKLENEVGTLRSSLIELTDNVNRLRDQLREVEIQAETQITSRMAHSGDREFDPLEFDRFTRLQELTRMMAESVSDVATVQQNLHRTIDGATNDLHVQARLTRELQQDLMRVRMIPFASISERLYRVTRQTSKEMDKRVNLDIRGTSIEIDRSVLEKMVGPFEHLLRNAIVHGIESREQRRESGKQEVGELLIEIRQEGNEVVIHFTDDGQGLNLERIRDKAKTVGLLSYDDSISDAEVVNMIFEPGFSTASEVTELAGRGVGMDVVRSEAASLGGRVSVNSVEGKGAHFTIHLPLTLAVTQVVILSAGGKTFAVPSVLVEQVQQLKSVVLTNAYNDGGIMWQGSLIPIYFLSNILGENDVVPLPQQYSPLLIMKSGNDRVAIHVDDIVGNREVVVKNIGPQLARMPGIAGATVLGSGDIVLILNPVPLAHKMEHERARHHDLQLSGAAPELGAIANLSVDTPNVESVPVQGLRTQHTVMVVDDSLTVRRVTQRLLLREGYHVVLAKDGIDALEQLQSVTPDVMLVDIEMPRMDGFDLTRNIRSDARTSHIPIIMITSRTADKHRNYAAELGVNEYFGKPYREDDLLGAIAGFVGKEVKPS
ncbi:Hpt domain-containing protein [Undibacterium sp. Ren11W]|uniref:hybrid sensor histidine kinase/response regulator n=1 Tax=Undibacterium sp. Ren11W TaxID=3413045 RepID=UPI003BF2ADF8